ncbi:MAG: ABC transporter substrate-binding protein, partial [Alphaproteobacteria bacterium]|nr:ABC transporter substrate-binding protein [Alphaproteobacteria bacterium]
FGGQATKAATEAILKPFTAETGITVNTVDYDGGLAQLRAMSESHNVSWDVMDMESQDTDLACNEGLLEPIDPKTLPNGADGTPASQDFIQNGLSKCGVGFDVWSDVIAYDASKFANEKPTTPADFFDIKKFPGKRGMSKRPNGNLEWALMADGVPVTQVYEVLAAPGGVDRAFKKLDAIRDVAVFWEAGAQPPQMLADGTVAMTTAYSGRIYAAAQSTHKPLVTIWDGQIMNQDFLAIPKGSKNPELAHKLLAYATSSKPLADLSKWIPYGPARKSSIAFVDKDVLPNLPTAPENSKNALSFGTKWWADHADEMNERFAAGMSH